MLHFIVTITLKTRWSGGTNPKSILELSVDTWFIRPMEQNVPHTGVGHMALNLLKYYSMTGLKH